MPERAHWNHQHREGINQFEPVAAGVCKEESAWNNTASSLDSRAAA
jgi:hypothetical protein